jgi:ketosteroid isomerase-like protein
VTPPPVEVAARGFDAYNRGDFETVFELLADDVVAVVSPRLPNEGTHHGHEGVREMLRGWEEAWEWLRIEPDALVEEGEWVIVPARLFGRGRGSGVDVDRELAYMLRVRGDRVTDLRICDSVGEALAVARAE